MRVGRKGERAQGLPLWHAVDRLVEALNIPEALAHEVGPLTARRLRTLGRDVPTVLALEERAAMLSTVVAQNLLTRVRLVVDGPIVLFKGPEVAAHYPGRARRFADLDLLVPDAEAVHRALLAAGFQLVERAFPDPNHHLHPIEWPGTGMQIEIHRRFNWPARLAPPDPEEIFETAVPSALGIDGIQTLPARQHALALVAHAWRLLPLRTLRGLIDVAAVAQGEDPAAIDELASAWGLQQAWQATCSVTDWLFAGGDRPLATRTWARHLNPPRDQTVTEVHLTTWLSPFWLLPARSAVRASAAAVARDLRPDSDQSRQRKIRQILRAVVHPLSPVSEHKRQSEPKE